MSVKLLNLILVCIPMLAMIGQACYAGPPFDTDDPQPVDYKHWEYYISTINNRQAGTWTGTSPHLEVNYGLVPHVQIHLLMPLNYVYVPHEKPNFGYNSTEAGIKYCFIRETEACPQVGTFPIVEIPTITNNNEFAENSVQVFLPLWVQKSWGKLTTYGGMGYWIRSGAGNKNSVFTGWEIQYDISPKLTMGGEIYYHTAEASGASSVTAFNTGGSLNFSTKTHIIFSVGHSLQRDDFLTSYTGLLFTI